MRGPTQITHLPNGQLRYDGHELGGNGQVGGPGSHEHPIEEVEGLQDALDAKSAVGHGHAIADVTNLQTTLNGKAASSHSHAIGDTTGLQTALDGKSATGHGHAIADTSGLQTALDGKAAATHSHAISDVTNLQTTLDGKASTGHTHADASTTSKGMVELATDGENAANVAVQGNDARMSNSRAPNGSASGDLGGSYPGPTVTQARGLRESGGTTLNMGAVADGEYIRRSGANLIGGTPAAADPGGWTTIVKSANQDVTNAQNQDATELQFAVVAGSQYAVELYLFYSGSDATGDFEYRFAVSAGTMDGIGHDFGDNAADAVTNLRLTAANAANTANIPHGCAANVALTRPATAQFTFRHNTTNGTFKVQFGNNTAAAGRISRIWKGSILRYKVIS